jgi:hypothetical protein
MGRERKLKTRKCSAATGVAFRGKVGSAHVIGANTKMAKSAGPEARCFTYVLSLFHY